MVGVGGGIEGLVGVEHPELADAMAVPKPLALRHIVRALYLEVAVGQVHLHEPGRGVRARGRCMDDAVHGDRQEQEKERTGLRRKRNHRF
jgi:hypothetical protein